jgi:hypothetical protein
VRVIANEFYRRRGLLPLQAQQKPQQCAKES